MLIEPIAHIRTSFPEKFGIPRQSGLAPSSEGLIVFEPQFRNPDAVRGLAEFDFIWLIWEFSANRYSGQKKWQPTVRPPRLGGNKAMGVFATRSPFRPNPLGLSSVRLVGIDFDCPDAPVIKVSGADLMDGTPIYDIKPYISYADSHPDAACGYVDSLKERSLIVRFADSSIEELARSRFGESFDGLVEVLSLDPRPSYQDDPERIYGLTYSGINLHFKVSEGVLTVTSI